MLRIRATPLYKKDSYTDLQPSNGLNTVVLRDNEPYQIVKIPIIVNNQRFKIYGEFKAIHIDLLLRTVERANSAMAATWALNSVFMGISDLYNCKTTIVKKELKRILRRKKRLEIRAKYRNKKS